MKSSILIKGLRIDAYIGIYDWEQTSRQPLELDLEIPVELTKVNDDIHNTWDYDAICKRLTQFIESGHFTLIETLAMDILKLLDTEFGITRLTLEISKPDAVANAANTSIRLSI